MAISNYSELKMAVQNWLSRADLAWAVPDFIAMCEAKLNRDLRCPQMEVRATTTVDLNSSEPEFVSLPTDFQTMRRVRLSGVAGKTGLECMAQGQVDDYRYSYRDTAAQPLFYSVIGNEMELLPTPNEAYELEMVYRATVPALSDSNTTNWLLTQFPDVYLYGSLLEASPYLEDDPRVGLWGSAFRETVEAINRLGFEQSHISGSIAVRLEGCTP